MKYIALLIAVITCCFGFITAFTRIKNLFYKAVVFSSASYLLAIIYQILYAALIPNSAFHVGYLTYAGTFFFLLCAFFSEPKEYFHGVKIYFRLLAMIPVLFIVICGVLNVINQYSILSQLLLIPVALTSYYAFIGLFISKKFGEYASAMRIFHVIVLILCLIQPTMLVSLITRQNNSSLILLQSLLSAGTVLSANRGCKRWST